MSCLPYPSGVFSLALGGPAGGDLAGTLPNPSVIGLQGVPFSNHPSDSWMPVYNQTTGMIEWRAAAAPSGPASGDLDGTYPNPNVIRIRGLLIKLGLAPAAMGEVLTWDNTLAQWGSGTVPAALGAQTANTVLAGPATGAAAMAAFRALVIADLPVASSGTVSATQVPRADDGRFWTMSTLDVYRGSGNVAVGTTPVSTNRVKIQGIGATAASYGLRVLTGSGFPALEVRDDARVQMINGIIVFSTTNIGNNVASMTNQGTGENITFNPDPSVANGRLRFESKFGSGIQMVTTGGGGVAIGTSAFAPSCQLDVDGTKIRIRQTNTPANSAAPGNQGDISIGSNCLFYYDTGAWWKVQGVAF